MSRTISYGKSGGEPTGGVMLTNATPRQLFDYLIEKVKGGGEARVGSDGPYVGILSNRGRKYSFEFDPRKRKNMAVLAIRPEDRSDREGLVAVMDDFLRDSGTLEVDDPYTLEEQKSRYEENQYGWGIPPRF